MTPWESTATRELRANNPLGVSTCRFTRLWGQVSEDNAKGDHLAVMPSKIHGVHAAHDLLKANYLWCGFFIPWFLGNKWAGDKTGGYGLSVARIMGRPAYLPLPFKLFYDPLMKAMAIMENGDPARSIPAGYFKAIIEEGL